MSDETPEQLANEAREFCARELPPEIRGKVLLNQSLDKADYVRWQKILRQRGWFGAQWPAAYGGKGWSKLQQWVLEQELYKAGAPWLIPFGVNFVGPVIYVFGNEEQKKKYLPPILSSDVWWCQGYSEPNAGSDLASLTTRAQRDGDHYVLSGQKTWTTMAQWADMIFVLARTSSAGRSQDGISFLLVDLQSRGVTVRPIQTIDRCHHLNEVTFDEVRVPACQLVGEENRGWTYAKYLLSQERALVAEVGKAQGMIWRLMNLMRQARERDPHAEDMLLRIKLAELEVDLMALETLCLEFLEAEQEGREAGAEVSLLKILGSELAQKISGVTLDVLGPHGLSFQTSALVPGGVELGLQGAAGAVREYLYGRAATIYGGSNEIQRNIMAKAFLGL